MYSISSFHYVHIILRHELTDRMHGVHSSPGVRQSTEAVLMDWHPWQQHKGKGGGAEAADCATVY